MRKSILIISLFLLSELAFCQYNTTIRSARPGQAFGPFTTGKNIFQIQTGVTYDSFSHSDLDLSGNGLAYAASFRYGLEENFEIRSVIAARSDKSTFNNTETSIGGISSWNLSVRYNIKDGAGSKASFAIQTDVGLNVVDEDYNSDDLAPRILLLHSQGLTEKLGLTTNWGIAWNGNNSTPTGIYVVNVSFPIAEKLGSFLEAYGNFNSDDFTISFDTGLAYLINNDFQLDITLGYGSNNSINSTFVDAGISWRTANWKGESK